jgi:hypothetical protein
LREGDPCPRPPGFRHMKVLSRAGRSHMRVARAIRMFSVWRHWLLFKPIGKKSHWPGNPPQNRSVMGMENWNNVQNDDDDAHISWSHASESALEFQWWGRYRQDELTTARAFKQNGQTHHIV